MLLISDLHLQPEREDISTALSRFLRDTAPGTPRLYILGDLFEAWLGDDAADPLADLVAVELHKLSETGTEIYFMHGNRDFLLGEAYAARCGGTLLEDPHLLSIAGHDIALLHGDTLCTRDLEYQKFRNLVRDPDWQASFLAQSLEQRVEFAREARRQSREATSMAASEIMDVTESAVIEFIRTHRVDTLIHGHTHRPAIHEVAMPMSDAAPVKAKRIVLGDWDKRGWYGRIDAAGEVTLHSFSLDG